MMGSKKRLTGMILSGVALTAMAAPPASAQFGGIFKPRDARNVINDAAGSDSGCEEGEKKSVGSRVLGGILGRSARRAGSQTGLSRWAPVSTFSSELTESIACRLDPAEQAQAANATLRATRSTDAETGEGDDGLPPVGSTASWSSQTRDDVSGRSTVTRREASSQSGEDCIMVTDVIIVRGEETTADKRMCRPPGSRRYSIVA